MPEIITPETDEPTDVAPTRRICLDPARFANYGMFRSAALPRGFDEEQHIFDLWQAHKRAKARDAMRAAYVPKPRKPRTPRPPPPPRAPEKPRQIVQVCAAKPAPRPASAKPSPAKTPRVPAPFNKSHSGITLHYADQIGRTLGQLYADLGPVNPQFIQAAEPSPLPRDLQRQW